MEPEIFHSVVRISYEKSNGTGTLVNSLEDEHGDYETYILTLYTNIKDAIDIEKKFDSLIGEERKMESRSQVEVSLPTYKKELEISGTKTLKAEIEAYSSKRNLAVLKLDDIREYENLSKIREISPKSLETVSVVGIGNRYGAPVILPSKVISKDVREKGRVFNLVNGDYLHRVSGSVVLSEEGDFIGIVESEVPALPDENLEKTEETTNLAIPLKEIKEWLGDEYLDYIFDESLSMSDRKEKREEYKERELTRRIAKAGLSEKE